jgi:hypothetical protein
MIRKRIAPVAIILGLAGALAGCGSSSGPNVNANLQSLLADKGIPYQSVTCAHQTGSEYACVVYTANGSEGVQVTDDGHTIVENGLAAGANGTPCTAADGQSGIEETGDADTCFAP